MTNQCEIVQDLLPLYIDKELSNESNTFIESHLATCLKCSAMKTDLLKSKQYDLKIQRKWSSNSSTSSPQELYFIKRITKWKRNSTIFGVCLILFIIFLLWMFSKENLVPKPVDKDVPIEKRTSIRWGNVSYDNITASNNFNNC